MAPSSEQENLKALEISNKYYNICEAKQKGDKTIWLGITAEQNTNNWTTRSHGSEVTFRNFKDKDALGDCAYLLAKVNLFVDFELYK